MAFKIDLLVILLSIIFLMACSASTPPGSSDNQRQKAEYLHLHNRLRAAIGVPPLRWNRSLASDARMVAELEVERMDHPYLDFVGNAGGKYWINGYGTCNHVYFTPKMAVDMWIQHEPGSLAQMVWNDTEYLACAKVFSTTEHNCKGTGALGVCLYYPPKP